MNSMQETNVLRNIMVDGLVEEQMQLAEDLPK